MKEWAVSFVACMLVVTLVENILPEGKYEKYIKYITAIVFLLTILSPLLNFLKESSVSDVSSIFATESYAAQTDSDTVYGDLMTSAYTSSVEESIAEKIVINYPKFEGTVAIGIDEDLESETYGAVTCVTINSNIKLNNLTIEKIINDFYSEGEVNININVLTEVE
jgi:stage III sporulation protein AF